MFFFKKASNHKSHILLSQRNRLFLPFHISYMNLLSGPHLCVYKMVTIYNSQILNVGKSLRQIILFFPNKIKKVTVFQTKKSLERTGEN